MKRLFISRDLEMDSIFHQKLSECFQITALSLIEFEPQAFDYPAFDFDWIFFYSKNGVRFFFEQLDELVGSPNIAAMGSGTSAALQTYGYESDFVGKGNPRAISKQFLAFAKNQTVLFPQAQHSKQSIQQLLENEIDSHSLLVYNNTKKRVLPSNLNEQDILVFTSPMNLEAYLDFWKIHKQQAVISIGTSTSLLLKKRAVHWSIESKTPDTTSIIKSILQLK